RVRIAEMDRSDQRHGGQTCYFCRRFDPASRAMGNLSQHYLLGPADRRTDVFGSGPAMAGERSAPLFWSSAIFCTVPLSRGRGGLVRSLAVLAAERQFAAPAL